MSQDRVITKEELCTVYAVMVHHNRNCGYIAIDSSDTLRFYDDEPSFGGLYVTLDELSGYIAKY